MRYLSNDFFARLATSTIAEQPKNDDFVVVYLLDDGPSHHQVFRGQRLLDWSPGSPVGGHLLIHRDMTTDGNCLLWRDEQIDLARTRVGAGARETDIWGLDLIPLPSYAQFAPTTTLQATVKGCPFRCGTFSLTLEAGTLRVGEAHAERSPDVELTCSYQDVIAWLHGDVILGHLMSRGIGLPVTRFA